MNAARKKFTVLVAVDDPDYQFLIKVAIAEIASNIEMNFVFNGEQMMHYLLKDQLERELNRQSLPNLIIADFREPHFGEKAVTELRSHEKFYNIPLYLLLYDYSDKRKEQLQVAGANDVIAKPHTFHDLKKALEKVIQKHQPKRLTQGLFCCRCEEYMEFDPNWGTLKGHFTLTAEETDFIKERFNGPLCVPCLRQLKTSYRIVSGKIDSADKGVYSKN